MIAKRHFVRRGHTPTVRLSSIQTTPMLTLLSAVCIGRRGASTRLCPTRERRSNWRPAQPSFVLSPSGCPDEALILAQKSMALNPNHPPVYLGILGNACRLSGHVDEAIAAFEAYNARQPGFGLVDLVIAYREKGQADKAEEAAKRLMSARRDFTIVAWLKTQFRQDTTRLEADVEALRSAGLPGGPGAGN